MTMSYLLDQVLEQVRELVQKLIEQKELINGEDESSDFDDI